MPAHDHRHSYHSAEKYIYQSYPKSRATLRCEVSSDRPGSPASIPFALHCFGQMKGHNSRDIDLPEILPEPPVSADIRVSEPSMRSRFLQERRLAWATPVKEPRPVACFVEIHRVLLFTAHRLRRSQSVLPGLLRWHPLRNIRTCPSSDALHSQAP